MKRTKDLSTPNRLYMLEMIRKAAPCLCKSAAEYEIFNLISDLTLGWSRLLVVCRIPSFLKTNWGKYQFPFSGSKPNLYRAISALEERQAIICAATDDPNHYAFGINLETCMKILFQRMVDNGIDPLSDKFYEKNVNVYRSIFGTVPRSLHGR